MGEILREHSVDVARVYVAGLSAAAYSELFAAAGVHSGLATGAASGVVSVFAAMRRAPESRATGRTPPAIVFHGDLDRTMHASNADEIVAETTPGAAGLRRTETQGVSAGGRAWTRATYVDEKGRALCKAWTLHSAGHTWSGGDASGSYADPIGPDASAEMLRFFRTAARSG